MTFAIITPALIAGAFAERMKFSAMLWFIGLWAILVYAPIAHWVWGSDGFMSNGNSDAVFKVLDFAGGTVVHINAGVAGLMCAICLGKRKDMGPPHNMVLTFIGASLLWVGWFGFNAGSAVTAGMQAGMAMTVTQIATAVAGLHLDARRMDLPRQADGHRHLLRCRRRSRRHHSGFGLRRACRLDGNRRRRRRALLLGRDRIEAYARCDDALDCFGVHGVGGIVGALLTGVFAISEYGGTAGLIEGNAAQMINQVQGIAVVIIYDAIVSLILLKVIDAVIGLRVSEEVEREGLDLALHGEASCT